MTTTRYTEFSVIYERRVFDLQTGLSTGWERLEDASLDTETACRGLAEMLNAIPGKNLRNARVVRKECEVVYGQGP